jgi:hypothetical protein
MLNKIFKFLFGQYPIPYGARVYSKCGGDGTYSCTVKYIYPGVSKILYEYFDGSIVLYKVVDNEDITTIYSYQHTIEKVYLPLSPIFHYKPIITHTYVDGILTFDVKQNPKTTVGEPPCVSSCKVDLSV